MVELEAPSEVCVYACILIVSIEAFLNLGRSEQAWS